jgi:hypothetical protein
VNRVASSLIALGLMAVSGSVLAQSSAFPIANSADLGAQYGDQSNDPRQVEMLFKEGNPIVDILKGLKDKGFAVDYKEKQVPRSMTLLSLPKSTRIDEVLREILEPWDLSLYHNPYGRWVVRPEKAKRSKKTAGDAAAQASIPEKSEPAGNSSEH